MLATLPVPILSVTAEAVRELQGQDALCGLWTIFTKCKESVQDGRRLENISWRLWYRELVQAQLSYQPLTPDSTKSHPKDERSLASFFPADSNEKVSPQFQALSSGLPSPSDQASPCPMSTMVPPPTPERPRISPHSPGSNVHLSCSLTRGKSTPCVGRLIVDMLPNQVCIPHRKAPHVADMTPVPSTPLPAPQSRDLKVPLVQLPSTPTETLFPRVVVVNPTPHPTPPTTPILHEDLAPQPPSTFLSPPLPPPALRPTVPESSGLHPMEEPSGPSRPLIPKEPLPPRVPARVADVGSASRQSDRRFFLQHSPEDGSLERGEGSTASGKSPSDLFEASSVASSQVKSVLTDVDVEEDHKEDEEDEDEDEDDRRSTATGTGAGGRHAHGRQKSKRGKEVGKARPAMRRSHSAKHVAPSMLRKLSTQQPHPQPHPQPQHSQERGRVEKKAAMFNIGSGSSNGSRSATGSSGMGAAPAPRTRASPVIKGLTAIQTTAKVSPPQAHPPVIPNGFANGRVVVGSNAAPNGSVNSNATGNVNANTQSRKTIVVANTSSEEYETTDGEDSEEWASEEMDAEDKAREAEETRLREAALEAQRQRELFAKIPKRSYSNLNRTQSGLLSQLMNPNPTIFPPNHPYRISWSSADISRQYQQAQQHATAQVQRSSSAFAPPRLSTSKSAAALPMAAQVTAISTSRPPPSSGMKRQESEKNGYRPKGPPKEQEMEDDSGDDADDRIQVSQSVAQQRLQALMSRRSSEQGTSSHVIQPVTMDGGPGLLSSMVTSPIPLGYPYNLPAATPPMTPRTTRRRMLKTELSESMRRQLLWERQVSSNTNPALVARRASQGPLGGLRPLTSTSNEEGSRDTASTKSAEGQDKDERRRRALARNRSWADDYHYSGW